VESEAQPPAEWGARLQAAQSLAAEAELGQSPLAAKLAAWALAELQVLQVLRLVPEAWRAGAAGLPALPLPAWPQPEEQLRLGALPEGAAPGPDGPAEEGQLEDVPEDAPADVAEPVAGAEGSERRQAWRYGRDQFWS